MTVLVRVDIRDSCYGMYDNIEWPLTLRPVLLTAHCGIELWPKLLAEIDGLDTVITKFTSRRSKSSPWFSSTLRAFTATVRHAENLYKCTHSALVWSSFKCLRNHYHQLIL